MSGRPFSPNILSFQRTTGHSTYALEITPSPEFKRYSDIEVELILYPYRNPNTTEEGVRIQPYDSYLEDLTSNQKTLYSPNLSYGANIFGLLLGLIITLIFWFFNQGELFGLQSIVAIIGVYLVGKEIWKDVEQGLIHLTERWRIRYYPSDYSFRLRSETTLDLYARFARAKKYRRELVLAHSLDMVRRSGSRDLKMLFPSSQFTVVANPTRPELRLCVVSFNQEVLKDFEEDKFLVAVKMSLNRKFFIFSYNLEWFEAKAGDEMGCLDIHGGWHNKAVFSRTAIMIGRMKIYLTARILPKTTIFQVAN
jgi:hypothetical protein